MDLIFASNNVHKLEEVQAIAGPSFRIMSLAEIGFTDEIPETGHTFADNARQKSRFVKETFGSNCFADDSGLEIDALAGEPGVYSARYSGSRDPEKNLELVLQKLEGVNNRSARFKTVICLIIDDQEHFFEGTVEGSISLAKSGNQGFGYDPIFIPEGRDITFADMSATEKNNISHRARALENMISWLLNRS